MKRLIALSLVTLMTLTGFSPLAYSQASISTTNGPPLVNNSYFGGVDTTAIPRALIGLNSSNQVSLDPDAQGAIFAGAVTISGAMTFSGNVTVAGTLGVTGATTLSSTLGVTGTSTFTGVTTFSTNVSISGDLDFGTSPKINATTSLLLQIGNTTKFTLDASDLTLATNLILPASGQIDGTTLIDINGASNDVDFRVGTDGNANAFRIDSALNNGQGSVGFGRAPAASNSRYFSINPGAITLTDNVNFSTFLIEPDGTLTVNNGTTSALITSMSVWPPNIIETGTVTTTAVYYAREAATEGDDNYTFFSDAGLNRFDGDGTDVFELPTDNTDPTGGGSAANGRIPVKIGGVTAYIAYYSS